MFHWGKLDSSLVAPFVIAPKSRSEKLNSHGGKRRSQGNPENDRKKTKTTHPNKEKVSPSLSTNSKSTSNIVNPSDMKSALENLKSHLTSTSTSTSASTKTQSSKITASAPMPLLDCSFWLQGKCNKGDRCTFSHAKTPSASTNSIVLCKFLLSGTCSKGDECPFSHDSKLFPCRYFHLTKSGCEKGDSCEFSHSPISKERLLALEQEWQQSKIVTLPPNATE